MDVPIPSRARARRRRAIIFGGVGLVLMAGLTAGLSRLQPAAPSVDRATVWIDTVKRGEMRLQVRGTGTLVPVEIRWIPAATEGRVERIIIQPGAAVGADSVILELSNPELALETLEAESQARAARAQLKELRVRLESQRLDQEAAVARVEAEHNEATLKADAQGQLAAEGLTPAIELKIAKTTAEQSGKRLRIEQERLAIAAESTQAQMDVGQAQLERAEALARLRRSQVEALKVRAGLDGILQQVPVEVGQRVSPGVNLARVAQPERLKAVVKIPETQAKDVQLDQKAEVDTRNGIVSGHVIRIDPAVQAGTVAVDIALGDPLPKGARPDLTVDGTIELAQLKDVLYLGRPAMAQPDSRVGLFRLEPDGRHAARVAVALGRASVSTVEIREGLGLGDEVILSDTSTWDSVDRIRLE
jgi:HlyD family secretion protein